MIHSASKVYVHPAPRAICPLHTESCKEGNSVCRNTRTLAFSGNAHSVDLNTHFVSSQPTMRWCWCCPEPCLRVLRARLNKSCNHPTWPQMKTLIDRYNRRWPTILDICITEDKAAYLLEADKWSYHAETNSAPRVFSNNIWERIEWITLVSSHRSIRLVNADIYRYAPYLKHIPIAIHNPNYAAHNIFL